MVASTNATASKKTSWILLLSLTAIACCILIIPYSTNTNIFSNSPMAGVSYMMVLAPIISILSAALIVIVYTILSSIFHIPHLSFPVLLFVPLLATVIVGNLPIVTMVVATPFVLSKQRQDARYIADNITISLSDTRLSSSADNNIYPFVFTGVLETSNTGSQNLSLVFDSDVGIIHSDGPTKGEPISLGNLLTTIPIPVRTNAQNISLPLTFDALCRLARRLPNDTLFFLLS